MLSNSARVFSRNTCAGHRLLHWLALVMPAALLLLAFPGKHNSKSAQVLIETLQTYGLAPALVTVIAAIVFYCYAMVRGVKMAEVGVVVCGLLCSVIGRQTLDLRTITAPQTWIWDVLAICLLVAGLIQRTTRRTVVGGVIGMCSLALSDGWINAQPVQSYLWIHLVFVCTMFLGLVFEDRFSVAVRRAAPILLPAAALFALCSYELLFPQLPIDCHQGYIGALAAIAIAYWLRVRRAECLSSAMLCMLVVVAAQSRSALIVLTATRLEDGLRWLEFGVMALLIAIVISFAKGRMYRRLWIGIRSLNRRLEDRPQN